MPIASLLEKRLEKSILQAKCVRAGHPNRIVHNSGSTPDTNESYECWHCERCGAEGINYLDEERIP